MNGLRRDPSSRKAGKALVNKRKHVARVLVGQFGAQLRRYAKAGASFALAQNAHKKKVKAWRAQRSVGKNKAAPVAAVQAAGLLNSDGGARGAPPGVRLAHGDRLPAGIAKAAGGLCVLFHPPIVKPSAPGIGPGRQRKRAREECDITVLAADVTVAELKRARAVIDSLIENQAAPAGVRVVQGAELGALPKASHKKKKRMTPDALRALAARTTAPQGGTQSVFHADVDADEDRAEGF